MAEKSKGLGGKFSPPAVEGVAFFGVSPEDPDGCSDLGVDSPFFSSNIKHQINDCFKQFAQTNLN